MGENGKKKKKKKGSAGGGNMFMDVSGTVMSGEYTGMMPTPADTEEKREAFKELL